MEIPKVRAFWANFWSALLSYPTDWSQRRVKITDGSSRCISRRIFRSLQQAATQCNEYSYCIIISYTLSLIGRRIISCVIRCWAIRRHLRRRCVLIGCRSNISVECMCMRYNLFVANVFFCAYTAEIALPFNTYFECGKVKQCTVTLLTVDYYWDD